MRLCLTLLLIISLPAFGEVYRWTDADGNVHFGDRPAGGGDSEQVRIRDTSPGSPAQDQPNTNELQQRLERLQREQDARRAENRYDQVERDLESRPDYVCQGARNRVKNYKDRWEAKRRQGYSVSEEDYYRERIREAERHRDNVCR